MNKVIKQDTVIYLSPLDVEKFMLFQKHYELFSTLLEKGVFEQRSAMVSLNFDHQGTLQTIQRADFLYSRKHE